ncbi:MAG: DUF6033 family protein [Selenomonadaceae bacterium]|nr:DUF6033 family protein [Selenomonadaceae bacterium]
MANFINTNYFPQFKNLNAYGKNSTTASKTDAKGSESAQVSDDTVELSNAGLNALTQSQTDSIDAYGGGAAAATDESKLSAKAQSYLQSLREKYGDYDFVVSSNPDAADTIGATKEISVILTPEEIEKMAEDDEYAEKVMGNVGNAVDTLNGLKEKALGEGVEFSQLSASIDSEGNMKLFAQLEQMSAEQKERFEAAKEKRAEEQKAAESKEKVIGEEEKEPEFTEILFKSADVEADSADELLEKILGIDWNSIEEETAYI